MSKLGENLARPQEAAQPELDAQASLFEGHALVTNVLSQQIEQRLAFLNRGEMLIIDDHNQLHESKASLYDAGHTAQVTFMRDERNKIVVFDGLPSYNGVKVGGSDTKILGAISLSEGAMVQFGSMKFVLPGVEPKGDGRFDQILADIYALQPGEKLTVGRRPYLDLKLPGDVSRLHATIERLEDVEIEGISRRLYRVRDGIPSSQGTYVESSEGTWEAVHAPLRLAQDRHVRIGPDGPVVQLPDPPLEDERNDIQALHRSIMDGSELQQRLAEKLKGREMSVGEFTVQHDRTCFLRNPDVDFDDKLKVSPKQAAILGVHIREGLKLIREEKYEEAISHFSNESVLKFCGFRFEQNNVMGINELTPKRVYEALQFVAMRSWFKPGSLTVYPSYACLNPDVFPKNDEERQLLRDFQREVCLVYAEETTHAYQLALGRNVSKKGELISGSNAHEVDVAQLFREQRVPMSHLYLAERYEEREIVLKRLEGYQTKEHVAEIKGLLAALPPGESLVVGRNPLRNGAKEGQHGYKIKVTDNVAEEFGLLSRSHVTITKQHDGRYKIEDGLDGIKSSKGFYSTDECGIWRKRRGWQICDSGSLVRLGKYFQIQLP